MKELNNMNDPVDALSLISSSYCVFVAVPDVPGKDVINNSDQQESINYLDK